MILWSWQNWGQPFLPFFTAYGSALNVMDSTVVYPAALEPDLATDTLQQTHMELGTDICKSAKSCPVSQSYFGALNQAVAVQEVAVSTNVLQEEERGAWDIAVSCAEVRAAASSSRLSPPGMQLQTCWGNWTTTCTSQKHLQSSAQVNRSSGIPSPGSVTSLGETKNKTKESKRNESRTKDFFFARILLFSCSSCSDSGPSLPLPWMWILGTQGRLGACVPLAAVVDELDDSVLLVSELSLSILRQTTNLTGGVSHIPVSWNLCPQRA